MKKDCILVLDIDGTLTHSIPLHQQALLEAMRALDLPHLNTDWGSYPHHTDTGILEHALAEHGRQDHLQDRRAQFEQDLDTRFASLLDRHGMREIAGARALTEAASRSRWGVVFATGGIRSVSRRKLDAVDIAWSEDLLVTSSEHASRHELVDSAVQRAMQVHGIEAPLAVVSMGDGIWDLRVAAALGLQFLGVGEAGSAAAQRLLAKGATVLHDLYPAIPALASIDLASAATDGSITQ